MAAKKKTGAAGEAAALPAVWDQLPFRTKSKDWAPRAPGADEDAMLVSLEAMRATMISMKEVAPKDVRALSYRIYCSVQSAAAAAWSGDWDSRDQTAHWFLHELIEWACLAMREVGRVEYLDAKIANHRTGLETMRQLEAKEKAERVARLAAGRKAAAERRAVAALSAFPRQEEVSS
ncbi:hypothetical protein Lcho_2189 [Leptothrix cholodnii SP-6]|uniref:Uncharacterized protein n=1 Tax=Leptothrix cholodnii (strain ATCC 51168 / LMG 8142 / SP-6) TaxID=395495 RepID=B1Y3C7_LEPCP|nr:hypothetical protein [Leptothrix cholodnii]ACB34455.1 hypothetical protein Lcho_2189 [Leptothrix cholodnii SP-6]